MPAGHLGLGLSLVDKHQAPRIKSALDASSTGPAAGDVGAILLAGGQASLNVIPSRWRKLHTAP
jgi:hypothetical protein